jgi:hypothetical protein
MPLITEVVDAIRQAQEIGNKVLTFVIPVAPEAIERSGLSVATIEDRVQLVLIAELSDCLKEESPVVRSQQDSAGSPVLLTRQELTDINRCLRAKLPADYDRHLLSSSEMRRRELLQRLGKILDDESWEG